MLLMLLLACASGQPGLVRAAPSLNLALSDGKEPRNDAPHDDDCLRYGESRRRRVRRRPPGLLQPDRQAAPVLP